MLIKRNVSFLFNRMYFKSLSIYILSWLTLNNPSSWNDWLFLLCFSLEFKEEMLRKKYEEETGSMAEERAKQEAEEHGALMAWNNEENQRLLKLRWEETQH